MKEAMGVILAGGKSTRMGTDKGLVKYRGKPMVQYVIEALKPACDDIVIVTNSNEYDVFGYPLIADELLEYGPVMGIYSALKHSKKTVNLILSCDVPNVSSALLQRLANNLQNHDLALACDASKMHPLIAAYHLKSLPVFEKAIGEGEHRLLNVIEQLDYKKVEIKTENALLQLKNINTQKELAA